MKKLITALFILIFLFCGCSKEKAKPTEKTAIEVNMPKDNSINGYRIDDGASIPTNMPETIKGEETIVTDVDTENGKQTSYEYCGNKNSKVFHLSTCNWVSRMNSSNKIHLSSRAEFISEGYKPCGSCNP